MKKQNRFIWSRISMSYLARLLVNAFHAAIGTMRQQKCAAENEQRKRGGEQQRRGRSVDVEVEVETENQLKTPAVLAFLLLAADESPLPRSTLSLTPSESHPDREQRHHLASQPDQSKNQSVLRFEKRKKNGQRFFFFQAASSASLSSSALASKHPNPRRQVSRASFFHDCDRQGLGLSITYLCQKL